MLSRRRMHSDRGAAAVEFALVLIPLLMIVFGIISFGITFSDSLALENAAREAARFGASYPDADHPDASIEYLRDVASTAQNAATGSLGTTVEGRSICVAKGVGSGTTITSGASLTVTGTAEVSDATESDRSNSWCFPNTAPGDHTVVQVQLQREGWVEVIVFSATPQLDGRSTARYER